MPRKYARFLSPKQWKIKQFEYRDVRACTYCSCDLTIKTATVDHIQPRSQGGIDDPKNYALACRSCNSKKHDKYRGRQKRGKVRIVTKNGNTILMGDRKPVYRNQRFGRLKALKRGPDYESPSGKSKEWRWWFECACSNVILLRPSTARYNARHLWGCCFNCEPCIRAAGEPPARVLKKMLTQ